MKLSNKKMLEFAKIDFASKKLPVKLAYALSLNIEAVRTALKAYDTQRINLVNEYAKKDEEGKPIIADDNYVIEDVAKWVAAIDELLMAEADVVITTIDLNDLEKCDSPDFDSLSVEELSAIGFMIA